MDTGEIIEMFDKYVIANYGRLPRAIVKGVDNYLYDAAGNEILDMFPGWAVSGIGHCHPKVVAAIVAQAGELLHIDNTFYIPKQGQLAKLLSERAFGGKCFFCNSGAEANEAAMKLARKHTAREKYRFITAQGSFHGRTFATVTATAQPKYHDGFLPMLPGFEYVPFNDVDALKAAFSDEVAAVMLEPIQGEGGINIATAEYLETTRQLCGYQHFDVEPDIITMAKALGGGVAIGAMMAKAEVAESLVPGTHASTFGGNPLACAAGVAVIEAIEQDNLLTNANKMGQYAMEKLRQLKEKYPIIDHVRGKGLMIGVQLTESGGGIVDKCLENGLRINCTQGNVLRIMPSMTVTSEQIDKAIEIIDGVLAGNK